MQEYQDNRDNPLHPMNQQQDPGHFYVPSPKTGESVVASTRISTAQAAMVGEVVASGQFPFRKPADVYRAALYYFLHDVIEPAWRSEGFSQELKHEAEMLARVQRQKRLTDAEKLVGMYVHLVGDLWRFDAQKLAIQEYREAEAALGQLSGELAELALRRFRNTPGLAEVRAAAEQAQAKAEAQGGGE